MVGTTLANAIGGVSSQTFALERRSVAHWIAQNHVTRMRIDLTANPRVLSVSRDTTRIFMAQREWDVRTQVIATDHPLIRRVEVEVFEMYDGERKGPYEHTIAFLGRH